MPDIKQIYDSAKQAEDTFFQVSPVPLGFIKTGIQNVGVPLAVATVATHTPFIAPVAGAAIHLGANAFQSATHHLAAQGMTTFGNSVMQSLPHALGMQSAYGAMSNAVGDVVLAGQDIATQAIGTVGATVMLGRTVANSAVVAFQKIRPMTINEILARGQQALQRSQEFLTNAASFVRQQGLKAENFVQTEVNKLNNNPEQSHNERVPETILETNETQVETPIPTPQPEPKTEPVLQPPVSRVESKQENELATPKREPDKVAQDYFQGLASELGGRNLNTEKMKIFFNNQEIFRLSDGQPDLNHTDVKLEHMAAFKEALADPQNFKGSLEIRQGSKLLLSIKDGQVYDPMNKVQELLSVKMEAPAESIPQTTTQGFYQKYSEGVNSYGFKGGVEIAKNAINGGLSQGEIVSMLLENNPDLKDTVARDGLEKAQTQAQNMIQKASDSLMMESPEVQQQQAQRQELEQNQSVSQSL